MKTPHTIAKLEKREFWANHVKKWRDSGLTQADYCQQHQLKSHQLTYWKQVFQDVPSVNNTDSSKNAFIAVQVTQPTHLHEQSLVIELPNGSRITGIHESNLNVVQAIIRWTS